MAKYKTIFHLYIDRFEYKWSEHIAENYNIIYLVGEDPDNIQTKLNGHYFANIDYDSLPVELYLEDNKPHSFDRPSIVWFYDDPKFVAPAYNIHGIDFGFDKIKFLKHIKDNYPAEFSTEKAMKILFDNEED